MKSYNFKRISAYLIDLFVVTFLITLLIQIKALNPNYSKYEKSYNNYSTYFNEILEKDLKDYDISSDTKLLDLSYKVSKYSVSNKIIETIVIILYFTLFPYFNNNQTIGKRLFKIKIEHKNSEKKVTIFQHFIRSIFEPVLSSVIIYNTLSSIISIILILVCKKSIYLSITGIIELLFTIFCYIDVILALAKKNHVSIHDRLSNTIVVENE